MQSTLHLIPAPLFPSEITQIPLSAMSIATTIKHYFVENVRTARRVLKLYDKSIDIDAITFVLIDDAQVLNILNQWHKQQYTIGIMSEAGLPAIADPGNVIVSKAHQLGMKVIPHSGPSSIILSLVASGFNGQQFSFLGYLPIATHERNAAIRNAEEQANKKGITQIFIETPYRNNAMLDALISQLNGNTALCIATNITDKNESIKTKKITEWKSAKPDLHKQPTIFLIGTLA